MAERKDDTNKQLNPFERAIQRWLSQPIRTLDVDDTIMSLAGCDDELCHPVGKKPFNQIEIVDTEGHTPRRIGKRIYSGGTTSKGGSIKILDTDDCGRELF